MGILKNNRSIQLICRDVTSTVSAGDKVPTRWKVIHLGDSPSDEKQKSNEFGEHNTGVYLVDVNLEVEVVMTYRDEEVFMLLGVFPANCVGGSTIC